MKNKALAVVFLALGFVVWLDGKASAQAYSGTSLSISGTGTIGTLVSSTASITSGSFGSLVVGGTADVLGDTLHLGAWASDSSRPGWSVFYDDGISGTNSSLTQILTRPQAAWYWQRTDGSGSNLNVLTIDANNRFILSGTDPNQHLILDPNANGNTTINGSPILTQTTADLRYFPANSGLFVTNGNIGIGTSIPSSRLDVNGNINAQSFTGDGRDIQNIQSNHIAGIPNDSDQVLKGDGSWGTVSSGGVNDYFGTLRFQVLNTIGSQGLLLLNQASESSCPGLVDMMFSVTDENATQIKRNMRLESRFQYKFFKSATSEFQYGDYTIDDGIISCAIGESGSIISNGMRAGYDLIDESDLGIFNVVNCIDWPTVLFKVQADGNIGIGTSTPQSTLDVNGSMNVSGPAKFSGPIRVEPQGDLDMGGFTNEPSGSVMESSALKTSPKMSVSVSGTNRTVISGTRY